MNRIYRVIWNCTLQVFQACSELTRRAGKTSTVNLRKSSGLTTKFSRLTLGVLLALSGSASGASLEVDNDQITNIDTDVAYDAYLVGWYGTGVLNILAGGNASLTTITTSVIGANEDSEGTVNVLGGTRRLYDSGNNARPLNVGQSGTGTLNIKQKGHVDGGYLRLGSSTGGVGTVNGLVVVNEHDNHDRQRLDSSLVYTGAHNVYYVKSCLSDAKCFSGSRYSFRVQELKPLLFHNWPVHGEIAWLFPAPC